MSAEDIDHILNFDPAAYVEPLVVVPDPDDDQEMTERLNAAAHFARAVTLEEHRMRVREAARRNISRTERADLERPTLVRLDHLLARQYDDPTYRIEHLWPTGGRMLLAAQWKAGKSTLVGNIIRALVDGDRFLDSFLPRQAGRVILIDDELDERTLRHWFADQNITNTEAVELLPLRGRVASFDILDPDSRAEWAKEIQGADVVILDCLRPIFDAFGLDENHEAGRFLVALDALLMDAGVSECGVIHHMGHGAERSRGDSRLLDWPDALWKIVRDKDDEDEHGMDDPGGSRYFSAYGRDVDQGQVEMIYDTRSRRLTLGHKTRHQATEDRHETQADEAVLVAVTADPGITKRNLRSGTRTSGIRSSRIDEAVERLVEDGLIIREVKGQTHRHYPTVSRVSDRVPTVTDTVDPGGVSRALRDGTPHTDPRQPEELTVSHLCGDCEVVEIAAGFTRCHECADRLMREAHDDD